MRVLGVARLRLVSIVPLAMAFLASLPAAAQQTVTRDGWEISLTPYVWATALKGDVAIGGVKAKVDADFNDVLDNLNVAVMLEAELRKGRFGIISDTVFAQLEDKTAEGQGRLETNATANMLIQTLAGTYRLGTWQLGDLGAAGPLAVTVDPYAGIRYTYLDNELKGQLDLPDLGIDDKRQVQDDKQWVDPIVGLRTLWDLGERWSLRLTGDVGGISTTDQYSAEAVGLVSYRFGLFGEDNARLLGGYRVLKQKFEDGSGRNEFDWDMTIHGPVLGLQILF